MKPLYTTFLYILICTILSPGCKKLVEVDQPATQLDAQFVYSKDANAISVLTGIYIGMNNYNGGFANGTASISFLAGLSADELLAYTGDNALLLQAYQNALTSANVPWWSSFYNYIYTANTAIQGLSASNSLDPAVKQQLLGEAKFLRAFFYFYLVNFWGDVPLVTTNNYTANAAAMRTPKAQVWQQIITDLKDAQGLLSNNFVGIDLKTTTSERIRPTKWAATALLARSFLYIGDFVNAEAQASSVLNYPALFGLSPIGSVFNKNSTEAIWQLQPTTVGYNTADALGFILTAAPSFSQPVSINSRLMSAFESVDLRKQNWTKSILANGNTYYYPYKYKLNTTNATTPSEYLMILRLGEQFLIRSEARAQQGNITGPTGAISDMDSLRKRAGLTPYSGATDKASVLSAIYHERQVELFAEWGHRWLDLKRVGMVDPVMTLVTPLKGGGLGIPAERCIPYLNPILM